MDELEFRRTAMIQPHDQQPDFLKAATANPTHRHYLDEMQQFDRALTDAMQVPVPSGLAERILLRQAIQAAAHPQAKIPVPPPLSANNDAIPLPPQTPWRHIAMAASVAFLLGISTRWITLPAHNPNDVSLADVAMAHVYGESDLLNASSRSVNLRNINLKMAKYGATLSEMDGLKVSYVSHCAFYQGPALHMVIQGEMGPINLFLVPKHVPLTLQQANFDDGSLKGEIVPLKGANLILIGKLTEPLTPVASKVQSQLQWDI
ncbi:MAG: DUF3379 family protein [Aeromonas sp.]